MRTTTRSRNRTLRTRHRRARRVSRPARRRARDRALLVLASLGLILPVGAYAITAADREGGPVGEQYACVESVGADKSGSQNSPAVIERWSGEVESIVNRAADCDGLIVVETVYNQPGKGEVRRIPVKVDGVNRLDKQQKRDELFPKAQAAIEDVLNRPAAGATNLLGWFDSVSAHLEDLPGDPVVNATLFTDGINTVDPVNMLKVDLSPEGVAALIDLLRPDLPDCRGWRIRMLGVNTTTEGGVDPQLAQGAERFWRAFIEACGGTLVRYDMAAQAP